MNCLINNKDIGVYNTKPMMLKQRYNDNSNDYVNTNIIAYFQGINIKNNYNNNYYICNYDNVIK